LMKSPPDYQEMPLVVLPRKTVPRDAEMLGLIDILFSWNAGIEPDRSQGLLPLDGWMLATPYGSSTNPYSLLFSKPGGFGRRLASTLSAATIKAGYGIISVF